MDATLQSRFAKPDLGQNRAHSVQVHCLAAMRGANDRELGRGDAECLEGARFDHCQGLDRLAARAQEREALRIAEPRRHGTVTVNRDAVTDMAALDQITAQNIGQRGCRSRLRSHARSLATVRVSCVYDPTGPERRARLPGAVCEDWSSALPLPPRCAAHLGASAATRAIAA